jgi:hypothetical protein
VRTTWLGSDQSQQAPGCRPSLPSRRPAWGNRYLRAVLSSLTPSRCLRHLAFVEKNGVAAAQMNEGVRKAIDAYSADETRNFAKGIEKKALSGDLG